MKEQNYNTAVAVLICCNVKVASEGKRYLGAVIGSETFKVSYTKYLVNDWVKQLTSHYP